MNLKSSQRNGLIGALVALLACVVVLQTQIDPLRRQPAIEPPNATKFRAAFLQRRPARRVALRVFAGRGYGISAGYRGHLVGSLGRLFPRRQLRRHFAAYPLDYVARPQLARPLRDGRMALDV